MKKKDPSEVIIYTCVVDGYLEDFRMAADDRLVDNHHRDTENKFDFRVAHVDQAHKGLFAAEDDTEEDCYLGGHWHRSCLWVGGGVYVQFGVRRYEVPFRTEADAAVWVALDVLDDDWVPS